MEEKNKGKMILKGLAETRKFFGQVSLLIRTAEENLKEEGWEPISSSYQSSDITSHLLHPQKWMPRWVARFFVNEEHEDILVYVGVLLDGAGAWSGFKEPWFTCGLFQYLTGERPRDNWKPQWLEWVDTHLYFEKDSDGKFHLRKYSPEEKEYESISGESTMALPLMEITDANALEEKVIVPLLEEIRNICRTNEK
jgi:hypothetical protein